MILIQCPARPISPMVELLSRPYSGYFSKFGTIGKTVMEAAVPVTGLEPAEATHAAPISAMDAACVGAGLPPSISTIFLATVLPIIADGIPVRGGAGEMTRPSAVLCGSEIGCGGANAIPAANRFEYAGL